MGWRCPNCRHKTRWVLAHRRWRCSRCHLTGRQPQRKTWISGLRGARRSIRKLVRYFVLGVPAYRLRFEVSLAPSTVLRIDRRIREAIYADSLQEGTLLGGLVEADETMFGGRRAGKRGWGGSRQGDRVRPLPTGRAGADLPRFGLESSGDPALAAGSHPPRQLVLHRRLARLHFLVRAGEPRGDLQGERATKGAGPHQRDRRILVVCQTLALPESGYAPNHLPSLSEGDRVPFQSRR